MSLPPGTTIGAFVITSPLGAGSMGEVYRARDTKLDREVALKILPESFASDADRLMRFEREAKALAALNHPHIAQIHGIEDSGATRALIMELVEGEDLAQRIARGPIPLDETLPIARQVADALEAAHDAGIVHRDLKPANIKVRLDGTVKVLDFGLARSGGAGGTVRSGRVARDEVPDSLTLTSPAVTMQGIILGTAAYMSPEQARAKPVDHRADIWAFGCVLYEMLTGRQLFAGETVSDTIAAILGRETQLDALAPDMPASIRRLLRRCLTKDLRARLHHIADARLELDEARSNAPDSLPTVSPRRRGRDLVVGALTGAALSALAVYLALRSTAPVEPQARPVHLSLPGVGSAATSLLVSPDGRYVVPVGSNGASTLHALDGTPHRRLDHMALCFSPDSGSLVLQRPNGELLKMPVSAGPAVAFATAPPAYRCSWSRDGTLLISLMGGAEPRLYQVPAGGGTATAVELDDDDVARVRSWVQFLPDGRRFLYWSMNDHGERGIRAGSLDGRQTTLVVRSEAPGLYTAGHLLFSRGAMLVAQPLDERTLMLSGEPVALTSEVVAGDVNRPFTPFAASESGMLAFATRNDGIEGRLVWVDRRGGELGTLPPINGAELLNPRLSPDGTRVLGNHIDPATGNADLWAFDLRTNIPTRLTRHEGADTDGVWSPDGTEVAYVSRRSGAPGIYRLSLADGREQLLLKSGLALVLGPGALRTTDWTRDGRFIVYDADNKIMALSLANTNAPIPVVATSAGGGKVSPDGRWLAYQGSESGPSAVYVQPFPTPGPSTRVSIDPGFRPLWRDDGAELFWGGRSPIRTPAAGDVTLYSAAMTFSGTIVKAAAARPVFPPHVTFRGLIDNRQHYAVAPDGQRFLLRQPDGAPGAVVKVILNWRALVRAQ
jgi:eukaryotic-like serine/threonine-protein kinase